MAMDHHMGIFATTGMGKSNLMKVFAASCMRLAAKKESKFGLLIVDPHGEYLKGKGPVKGLMHLKNYAEGLNRLTRRGKWISNFQMSRGIFSEPLGNLPRGNSRRWPGNMIERKNSPERFGRRPANWGLLVFSLKNNTGDRVWGSLNTPW
jgi:hypothetical protein